MKKFLCVVLTFVFLLSSFQITASAENSESSEQEQIYDIINSIVSQRDPESSDCIITDDIISEAGSSVSDWFAFSAGRLGRSERFDEYISAVEDYLNNNQTEVVTDFQRLSLTVLACGGDPVKLGLTDKAVFSSLSNDNMGEKTVNCIIYGLLTLDSVRYEIPEDLNLSRASLITQILCSRLESGAFALSGDIPDTDITAMAIQALVPYYNSSEVFTYNEGNSELSITVREAVDTAVDYLSSIQLDDGDMPTWGSATCETTAQTVIALCSLGINPDTDERFIKNGNSLIDGLLKYSNDDGGFAHTLTDGRGNSNSLATVQSLYALCAYCRFVDGYRNLFDMRSEMSSELKSNIDSLIASISNINTDDEDMLKTLLADYTEIPVGERSYVCNFYILADALESHNIENTGDYTADEIVNSEQSQLNKSNQSIESADSAVTPLEISSRIEAEANDNGNAVEVIVLILIGIAAASVIIFNHRKKNKD